MVSAVRRAVEVALALAAAGVGGCRPEAPAERPKGAGFIAVVGAGRADPLWPVVRAAAARFQGQAPNARIRAEAPGLVSPNLQVQLLCQLRDQGMRGLCIQIQDPPALAGELESLRSKGIAVVTMMQPVKSQTPFLHSGVDPDAVGAALADALSEQILQGGTLGVLHNDDSERCRRRRQGFLRRLARYPRLSVLRELDCEGDAARAVGLMRRGMERFPGIDGWVALDSWPVQHPDDGLPLLPPGCALVLPGPLPDYQHQLATDRCRAVVVADYEAIVTRALEMCLVILNQEIVQVPVFEAPPRWVTLASLSEFQRDWAAWTSAPQEPPAAGSP